MTTIKRSVKDTLFTDLFSDPKYLFQLYQSLHPEDQTAVESDLRSVTLQAVLVTGRPYNDLGFQLGDHLIILVEEQSSWSPNIVLRAVDYLIQTYMEYLEHHGKDGKPGQGRHLIYENTLIRLPKPELYVVYPGPQGNHPDHLSLKSLFFDAQCDVESQPCDLDATVHVIYDNSASGIVKEYTRFCRHLEAQKKIYGPKLKALEETIRICKEENILVEYLEKRKVELMDIMDFLFNEEEINRSKFAAVAAEAEARGETRGEARGEARGKAEERLNSLAKLMKTLHLNIEQAMDALEIPLDQRSRCVEVLSQQPPEVTV